MSEVPTTDKNRNFWKYLTDWFHKAITVVQNFQTLSWLVGLLFLGGISGVLVYQNLLKWLIEPLTERIIPINSLSLLLTIVVPVLIFSFGYKVQKYYWKKKRFFFTTTGPFKWKTDITTRKTSNKPYCRKHELGMLPNKDGSWCPAHPCKVGKNISSTAKGLFLLIATQKAEAKLDKHLKINIFIKLKSWWRFRKKMKELNKP